MLIIRRRLPSGQRRIIPLGGANVFSSIKCQAEAQLRSASDILSRIEALTGTRSDAYGVLETNRSLSADILSALETVRFFSVDEFLAVENQHNTAVSSDGFFGIESVTRPVSDVTLQFESGLRASVDEIAQLTTINTLKQTDAFGALESGGFVRTDFLAWSENQGALGVTSDGVLNIESTARVVYDPQLNAESVIVVRPVDIIANTAVLASLVYDSRSTQENLGQLVIAADGLVRIESIFNIFPADARSTAESILGFRVDLFPPAESLSGIATTSVGRDAAAALEVLGRAQHTGYLANIENLGTLLIVINIGSESETLVTDRSDAVLLIENTHQLFTTREGAAENLAWITPIDSVANVEAGRIARSDPSAWIENLGQLILRGDAAANVESLVRSIRDALGGAEATLGVSLDSSGQTEYGRATVIDSRTPVEFSGELIISGDGRGVIEILARPQGHAATAAESLSLVEIHATAGMSYLLMRRSSRMNTQAEIQSGVSLETAANLEAQTQRRISTDVIGWLEVAGQQVTFPQIFSIIMETGQGVGSIPGLGYPLAWVSLVGTGIDPAGDNTIPTEWGPFLVLNKAHTAISSGRVRLVSIPYTAPVIQARPFDPLAALSQDTFGFDLSADAGGATVISNTWTATFDPGSTQAYDDVPIARILTTWSPTTIYETNPLDNTVQAINGIYACAFIGTCPATAVGGTYTVVAHVIMSDTREWRISSNFLCTQTT